VSTIHQNLSQAAAELLSVSPARAAELLDVSKTTIRLMLRDGRLPFSRIGRRIVIQLDDLKALLASTRVAA
jgi:excisionase family DNA binding protein